MSSEAQAVGRISPPAASAAARSWSSCMASIIRSASFAGLKPASPPVAGGMSESYCRIDWLGKAASGRITRCDADVVSDDVAVPSPETRVGAPETLGMAALRCVDKHEKAEAPARGGEFSDTVGTKTLRSCPAAASAGDVKRMVRPSGARATRLSPGRTFSGRVSDTRGVSLTVPVENVITPPGRASCGTEMKKRRPLFSVTLTWWPGCQSKGIATVRTSVEGVAAGGALGAGSTSRRPLALGLTLDEMENAMNLYTVVHKCVCCENACVCVRAGVFHAAARIIRKVPRPFLVWSDGRRPSARRGAALGRRRAMAEIVDQRAKITAKS